MTKREPHGKYWICNECAKEKGWTAPDGAVTCIGGVCGWCDGKKQIHDSLTPTCDYDIPGQRRLIPFD